ncbi:MAG TPA: hypothetical protein VKT77_10685 [Chthonomonadaceae bacterium]|nr:hypothetical protein [Chthonomonadaceae bacterium]
MALGNVGRYRNWLFLLGGVVCLSALGSKLKGTSPESALAIWRKSLISDTETPMRAEITMTQRRHGQTFTTKAHMVRGAHGRYRMEYVLPAEARGRIVFSDGQTNWQYEPTQNVIARTELPVLPDADRALEGLIEANYRIVLVSSHEAAADRPVYLVDLLPRHAGKSSQRRWIDRQSYKTLRLETRYTDGILARSMTYDQIALPAVVTDADFQPMRAKSVRMVSAPTSAPDRRRNDFSRTAASLDLKPQLALGFKLIEISSSTVSDAPASQLLYCDGIETVSIFVQGGRSDIAATPSNWQRLAIRGVPVFQNIDGHLNTLVWVRNGRRYTAVSHLVPQALQAVVTGQMP